MKTFNVIPSIALAFLVWGTAFSPDPARAAVERVVFKGNQVLAVEGGKETPLTEDVKFPNQIVVSTNGTFRVGEGKERKLTEGQSLAANGMLSSPNGRIEPVTDHLAVTAGKTVSNVNGEAAPTPPEINLNNGARLSNDRVLRSPNGTWSRVIDGQMFSPEGKPIPAVDTVSLQSGKVVVQKDGSLVTVAAGRSMMMNDGTKVFADGTVVSRDGKSSKLTEGQVLQIEGVVKRR
jgi:hypothetical protein